MERGREMMSRWRFDRRTHLEVTSEKTQHEEDRMRDIHVGRRGSEAAGEDQPDKLKKTVPECSSVFRPNCCSGISCEL